jgi:replicative DNA helicase
MSQFEDITDEVTRSLPHAVGPEKSLLSSMLQDPQDFLPLAIEEGLTKDHFYLPAHSTLYGFLVDLFEKGTVIELVSLVQLLLNRGQLDSVGGPSGLTDLYTYSPSSGHFRYHLQHVKDKYVLRSIIQTSNQNIEDAYDTGEEVSAVLDAAETRLLAIRNGTYTTQTETVKDSIHEILDELQRTLNGDETAKGMSTGFEELDRMCSGLKPGDMFVIAARPSMGKTSLMMNIVEHVCVDGGKPTMVFSCEMQRKQLVQRMMYSRAKFAHSQISRGSFPTKGDLQRIKRASMEITAAKLFIDDQPGISITQLRAKARRRHRESKLELIAVDYLQLMKSTSKQAQGNREREIAEISAGLKALAKELHLPVVVLAQLNRGPEQRTGKGLGKPRMSDLRESGAIEQDADLVGLLYRSAYYAEDDATKESLAGQAELVMAKNRNGSTGTLHLTFIDDLMRFETGAPVREEEQLTLGRKDRWDT